FIMASGFIADTTSLPFIVSNLVNIVSADFFGIGFVAYAARMILPNIFSLVATIFVLFIYFLNDIPRTYALSELQTPKTAIRDQILFRWSWVLLGILVAGYFASEWLPLPVSAIAGAVAIAFMILSWRHSAVGVGQVIREAPWD